ncbi:MAG: hypothetical protein ACYTFY_09925 [Planctomycetota bacterium]|jgi:hypothetical protein
MNTDIKNRDLMDKIKHLSPRQIIVRLIFVSLTTFSLCFIWDVITEDVSVYESIVISLKAGLLVSLSIITVFGISLAKRKYKKIVKLFTVLFVVIHAFLFYYLLESLETIASSVSGDPVKNLFFYIFLSFYSLGAVLFICSLSGWSEYLKVRKGMQ